MFYVFLVGLAKLHCGATPPSVMVLLFVASLVLIAVDKQTLGDMGLLPHVNIVGWAELVCSVVAFSCLFVACCYLSFFVAFVCCLFHHLLLVCCIFLRHVSFFAFSNTDRTDVNFQGCLLHRLH